MEFLLLILVLLAILWAAGAVILLGFLILGAASTVCGVQQIAHGQACTGFVCLWIGLGLMLLPFHLSRRH
jgi:hypothetical protein